MRSQFLKLIPTPLRFWLPWSLLLAGATLRLSRLGDWSLWFDEETSIYFALNPHKPFPRAFPLYFWVLGRVFSAAGVSVYSARLISAHRPTVPIYALSPGRETVRRCGLMWGVKAASMKRYEVTEELIAAAARRVVELGWLKPGDRVGITAGLPSGKPGTTSLLQIQEV